ncbi:uncharacterized protein DS421_19g648820 [Arachis hypogaea]|uniref:Uncharacterized protein n=1 Tax=Arachis hypogaea TaxID=3818 RepID=A0A6B9V6W1_ARAHY|nr:uncharacterized protein DS421_19g648820 [Arachis hypogaea]
MEEEMLRAEAEAKGLSERGEQRRVVDLPERIEHGTTVEQSKGFRTRSRAHVSERREQKNTTEHSRTRRELEQ